MIIQIYAFTNLAQALEAAEIGVDHIGFVAGDYGQVPGELSFPEARRMADALRGKATRVALTMATDVDEILRMADTVQPDIIHISTDPEDVGVEKMAALRKDLHSSIRLMKALHVTDDSTITLAEKFAGVSDIFLLDTKLPDFPGVGATGHTHNWAISREIIQSVSVPVILAGGLNTSNVGEAIKKCLPWGVDSNTWTNISGDPVAKDMTKIREFVRAARAAEGEVYGRNQA